MSGFEVVTFVEGARRDTAEADDPKSAIAAARQLIVDAENVGVAASKIVTRFYLNGMMIREWEGEVPA